ncbi:MAG: HAMP domain-containing protein [Candidatus Komeilibacteria bacterium]|jgi:C4-dicarboxylate-specific signal transduction histidine kinase|nr:HAMP domain-containing protein [Candidatus Komeilibacteria bacterium]
MIRSLKSKLIFAVAGLIIAFGALATVFSFYYIKGVIFDINIASIKDTTHERSHETERILDNVFNFTELLATRDQLTEYLEDPETFGHDDALDFLNLYNIEDSFLAIYVMDENGDTLVSTDPRFTGNNYGFRSYFKKAINGEANLSVVLGTTSKQLGYYFARPVTNSNNQTLGVVIIKMNPTNLDESMHFSLYGEREVMLLDEYGIIISSEEEGHLYNSIGKLTAAEKLEIKEERRFEGVEIKELTYQEPKDALDGLQEATVFQVYDERDGEEEIVSIVPIGDFPLFLFLEQSSSVYINLAKNIAYILSIIIVLAVLFSAAGVFWFINRILKPLGNLKEASQAVAKGNLGIRVDIKTGDELEDLANSFNKMTIRLQKNITDIENKVAERTATLEKINKHMIGRELKMVELKNKNKNKLDK